MCCSWFHSSWIHGPPDTVISSFHLSEISVSGPSSCAGSRPPNSVGHGAYGSLNVMTAVWGSEWSMSVMRSRPMVLSVPVVSRPARQLNQISVLVMGVPSLHVASAFRRYVSVKVPSSAVTRPPFATVGASVSSDDATYVLVWSSSMSLGR